MQLFFSIKLDWGSLGTHEVPKKRSGENGNAKKCTNSLVWYTRDVLKIYKNKKLVGPTVISFHTPRRLFSWKSWGSYFFYKTDPVLLVSSSSFALAFDVVLLVSSSSQAPAFDLQLNWLCIQNSWLCCPMVKK